MIAATQSYFSWYCDSRIFILDFYYYFNTFCIKQSEVNLLIVIRLTPIQMSNDINIIHNYYNLFVYYVYKYCLFYTCVILLWHVGEGPVPTVLVTNSINCLLIGSRCISTGAHTNHCWANLARVSKLIKNSVMYVYCAFHIAWNSYVIICMKSSQWNHLITQP